MDAEGREVISGHPSPALPWLLAKLCHPLGCSGAPRSLPRAVPALSEGIPCPKPPWAVRGALEAGQGWQEAPEAPAWKLSL